MYRITCFSAHWDQKTLKLYLASNESKSFAIIGSVQSSKQQKSLWFLVCWLNNNYSDLFRQWDKLASKKKDLIDPDTKEAGWHNVFYVGFQDQDVC